MGDRPLRRGVDGIACFSRRHITSLTQAFQSSGIMGGRHHAGAAARNGQADALLSRVTGQIGPRSRELRAPI